MKLIFKIAVVHNNILLKKYLKLGLEAIDDIEVAIDTTNLKEMIAENNAHPVNVLIVDADILGIAGLTKILKFRKNHPSIIIMALTTCAEQYLSQDFKELGISTFLYKNTNVHLLVKAIKDLDQKDKSQDKSSKNTGVNTLYPVTHTDVVKLSEREIEIIPLVSQQMTCKEIADKLCVNSRTIDGHKERIMQKTDSKNAVGIIMYAVRFNLLDEERTINLMANNS